jgi:hypothetical protein
MLNTSQKQTDRPSRFLQEQKSVHPLSYNEGRKAEVALMIDRHLRSSYESDWLPYTKETARRAVRIAIGQALRARFETLQELSDEIQILLVQVNATHEEE